MKTKKGISLIVLVLTVIVLSILAGAVIITLNSTNVIGETRKATFKSDMSGFKEAYDLYVIGQVAKNRNYDKTKLNVTYGTDTFKEIFGENIPEKYSGLKVICGKLTYESTDEIEKEIAKELGMSLDVISKDTSYVGYFADIDGDGNVDGVIFADLCIGGSGKYFDSNGTYTISKIQDTTTVKEYYVSQASYTVTGAEGYGTHPVLTAMGSGKDRFYVMALEDINTGTNYTWYDAAADSAISNWNTVTSTDFGKGKENTQTMIEKWNAKAYGAQNEHSSYLDIWGIVQDKVYGGKIQTLENVKWFVPSKEEWAAFAASLGSSLTTSNYVSSYGLNKYYWSSSLGNAYCAWDILFSYGLMNYNAIYNGYSVRLATTF